MEEQNHDNSLQLMSSAFGGSSSDSYYSQLCPGQPLPVTAASYGNPSIPTTLPHWIYWQQIPQNYVESMSETGASQVQKGVSFFNPSVSTGSIPIEASIDNAGLKISERGYSHDALGYPPKVPKSSSRQKSDVGRCHRTKIAERFEAMRELLRHSNKLSRESIADDIIDYIKDLKTQIKDLSQSRLGGEPSCMPHIFREGFGHYLLHEELQNESVEEMIGKLLEVNPFAATQLLESRGLFMMPASLAEGLPPQI